MPEYDDLVDDFLVDSTERLWEILGWPHAVMRADGLRNLLETAETEIAAESTSGEDTMRLLQLFGLRDEIKEGLVTLGRIQRFINRLRGS